MNTPTRWNGFDVTGPAGSNIPLRQIDASTFHLGTCTITYRGTTGLERFVERGDLDPELHEQVRTIDEQLLPTTDLASVPGPLRWFTNTYGPHTPAALIHDYLIPDKGHEPLIPEEYADRYFRFMLASVGVPRFKRFIMWAAVAMRTRLKSRRPGRPAMLGVWALAALVGVLTFFAATADLIWGNGTVAGVDSGLVLVAAMAAPFVFSGLWGRQYGAGIVTALAAPWIVPATIVTSAGYAVYWLLERIGNVVESVLNSRNPANV